MIHPAALEHQRGGKKNLKIAKVLVDDEDDEEAKRLLSKPKIIVVGGGWGAVAFLKHLKPGDFHVTVCILVGRLPYTHAHERNQVVSPVNYNLFTPLLPSACVGTVEIRSLVESLHRLVKRVRGHYLSASAVDVDLENRLLEVKGLGSDENFYIP
jgi:NADH dehydrogenase FAD-containing subunit